MNTQPRLRMFAGPNGSGKSTLTAAINPRLLGVYVNPDEIEKTIVRFGFLDLSAYGVVCDAEEILSFFRTSSLLKKAGMQDEAACLTFTDNKLDFYAVMVNAYFASVASDFIRQKLLQQKTAFTFETVMSYHDKVELLKQAQQHGFKTCLYYVATEDPAINISRVRYRHLKGGHDVPKDKIESRFYRSLRLLPEALKYCHQAYFFDNSGVGTSWIAEMNHKQQLVVKTDRMPLWFQDYVLPHFK